MLLNTEISLTSIEKGFHTVKLYDVKGNVAFKENRNLTSEGIYTVNINTQNILTGSYLISFETPTQKFFKNIVIMK